LAVLALTAVAASSVAATPKPTLDYYKVVGSRNLFRKLGWRPPNQAPQYTLLLTAVSSPVETQPANVETDFWSALLGKTPEPPAPPPEPFPDRALIAQNGTNSVFYVGVGDRVRNFVVKSIETGRVTMTTEDNKETQTLTLQEMQLTSGGGGPTGGGAGGGPGRFGGQSGQGPRGASGARRGGVAGGAPPNFEQMRQRFQNMSPEEREQLRNQFRQRGGNGGGGIGGGGEGGGQGRGSR
jgi:hypothetical protein